MLLMTPKDNRCPEIIRREQDSRDRWACIYRANPILRRCGVSLDDFLAAPNDLTAALLTPRVPPSQDEYAPLLPGQRRVRDFLDVIRASHRGRGSDNAHA